MGIESMSIQKAFVRAGYGCDLGEENSDRECIINVTNPEGREISCLMAIKSPLFFQFLRESTVNITYPDGVSRNYAFSSAFDFAAVEEGYDSYAGTSDKIVGKVTRKLSAIPELQVASA